MSQDAIHTQLSHAIAHNQAGRLQQAAEIYQQILAHNPQHADALRLLGVIAHQFKKHDAAEQLLRQAIAVNATIPEYHNDLALVLQAQGRLVDAAAECRVALKLNPHFAEAHYNLGNVLKAQARPADALAAYREALRLRPAYPEASNNLGNVLIAGGKIDEAIPHFQNAARLQPHNADARINLASALDAAGRNAEAIEQFLQLLPLRPSDADLLYRYANALLTEGTYDEAVLSFRQSLTLEPGRAPCHNNLGVALQNLGRHSEAAAAFRRAIQLEPEFPEAHNNLGNALKSLDELDAAIAEFRAALAVRPNYAEALSNLGSALKDRALVAESIDCFRKAVDAKPDDINLASNLVYMLHFDPRSTPQSLAGELAHWNTRFGIDVRSTAARRPAPGEETRDPDRRLRIGWVSPDFRRHPIGRFLLPIFSAHDAINFPFYCYSDVPKDDELTTQLRTFAQHWHNTAKLSHDELAALIVRDQIDILIDLTMHMQGSRLPVFAKKPAPIQMTYLAYCSSTGVPQIDYRLTDPFLETPATPFVEKPLPLQSYWCYAPEAAAPEVRPLPAATSGTITFGNLNNFCKASPPALDAWVRILQAIPNSQLLLHAPRGSARDRVFQLLIDQKVDPARCRFVGMLPFDQYIRTYHQIDIALDPFPYTGGTTSCDALWMGAPILTLAGNTGVGRSGVSLLSQLGLMDWIVGGVDDYVALAARFAGDLKTLSELRSTLRPRMLKSRLTDAAAFADDLQGLFRKVTRL